MAKVQPAKILTIPLGLFGSRGIGEQEQVEIISQLSDFIQCSETCVLDDVSASTALPPAKASNELQPVFLPAEIILHVLEYLNEPYKLQGRVCNISPDIVFCKPRMWANIPAFQICHATRAQALKRYGNPSPNSLPFDACVDSVYIQPYPILPCGHPVIPSSERKAHEKILQSEFPEPRYRLSYNNVDGQSASATNPGKQLCDDFRDKIQCVEVEASSHPYFYHPDICWGQLAVYLGDLKDIRKLKINLEQHDTCGSSAAGLNTIGDPRYHCGDLTVLRAFIKHLPLIKSLEVFEIEKIMAKCIKGREGDLCSKKFFELLVWHFTDRNKHV
ncbi:hypothetical protein F4824DRAFT_61424 [Ustulina deusta]|nr:hypothetical protein F4824DRAFT_61424 [Ustulina deusta]